MTRALAYFDIRAQLACTLTNTIDGGARTAQVVQGFTANPPTAFTSGTTASKADIVWSDTDRAILSGANDDLDLYDLGSIDIGGGAGKDALGNAIAIAEIVAILIRNDSTSTGSLIIGGEGSGAAWNSPFNASDTATMGPIAPGGWFYLFNPADPAWTVADATNHLLRINASGGNVTYDIAFLGRSA